MIIIAVLVTMVTAAILGSVSIGSFILARRCRKGKTVVFNVDCVYQVQFQVLNGRLLEKTASKWLLVVYESLSVQFPTTVCIGIRIWIQQDLQNTLRRYAINF